jgi:hypothetical protein
MSQMDPTDLLCRSRREQLSLDEQRRLNECLERSLEVALMSQMLSELERESRVRPGDDALLARIAASALGTPRRVPSSRRRRPVTMLLVAAAVLLLAGLASALLGRARQPHAPDETWTKIFTGFPWQETKRGRSRSVLPSVKPIPSQAVPAEPEPGDHSDVAREIPSAEPTPAPSSSVSRRTAQEPRVATSNSASELFARANLLRRQGRGVEAAELYQLLLELHPTSREGGPTRLALAKYFQAKRPQQALALYRAVARSGGVLRAEALWGISETATTLGERALSEQALADLIREFPDSPYAEVARTRTTHGSP